VAPLKKEMMWLIVGGDGQLGRSMAQHLANSGVAFKAVGRSSLDITNVHQVESVLRENQPDVVLNAAAWTNVDLAEEAEEEAGKVNTSGAAFLAAVSKSIGARFVQISTDYVFSGNSKTPRLESSPTNPDSAYGRTKAEAERLVQEIYPEGTFLVRTAWLYGPYGRNFAKTMARMAERDSEIVDVVDDQIGQPTYSMDLADQILTMFQSEAPAGIYHGTNSGSCTWYDFARQIFTLAGEDPERVQPITSEKLNRKSRRPDYSVLGHQHWIDVGMEPMRDWQLALEDAFSSIRIAAGMEE
jgi:dTDP-4-dehydrorhamnose reductase